MAAVSCAIAASFLLTRTKSRNFSAVGPSICVLLSRCSMTFLAVVITALLLPLVPVMVWRCWNLPPVPATRLWALAFGGMSAGMLYQFWRAEAWKKETEKLELKLQGQRLLPRRQASPKTTSLYRDRRLLDAGFPGVTIPSEPDIVVGIADVEYPAQRKEADLQNIVRIQLFFRSAFHEVWTDASLLSLSQPGLCQPCSYFSELHPGNREPILTPSWQSVTLIKRLWTRSRKRPNPSQLRAKSFWNPKSLNASYARLRSPAKPLFQQTIEKAGKVRFPPLSALNVLLSQGDGICGLALWLPASAFSFSASPFHLKKYVVFLLTNFESIRILSSSQGTHMANKRLSASNYYRSLNRDRCGDLCLFN